MINAEYFVYEHAESDSRFESKRGESLEQFGESIADWLRDLDETYDPLANGWSGGYRLSLMGKGDSQFFFDEESSDRFFNELVQGAI